MKGGSKNKSMIDSSISPRLNDDTLNDDEGVNNSIVKFSPYTLKMDIGNKKLSFQNKDLDLSTFRSTSTKHRIKNYSILESIRDSSISRPIIISKRKMITPVTSNRKFRENPLNRSSYDDKYIVY